MYMLNERCMNGKKNSIKMGDRSMLKQRFVTTSMMYNHHNHHDCHRSLKINEKKNEKEREREKREIE